MAIPPSRPLLFFGPICCLKTKLTHNTDDRNFTFRITPVFFWGPFAPLQVAIFNLSPPSHSVEYHSTGFRPRFKSLRIWTIMTKYIPSWRFIFKAFLLRGGDILLLGRGRCSILVSEKATCTNFFVLHPRPGAFH